MGSHPGYLRVAEVGSRRNFPARPLWLSSSYMTNVFSSSLFYPTLAIFLQGYGLELATSGWGGS